jgi:hypothetical protein
MCSFRCKYWLHKLSVTVREALSKSVLGVLCCLVILQLLLHLDGGKVSATDCTSSADLRLSAGLHTGLSTTSNALGGRFSLRLFTSHMTLQTITTCNKNNQTLK